MYNLSKCLTYHMLYISVTEKNECESELDCPGKTPCSQPLSYISNMELLIDDFNFSFGDIKKRCIFTVASVIEPHTGGGNIFVNYPISGVNDCSQNVKENFS